MKKRYLAGIALAAAISMPVMAQESEELARMRAEMLRQRQQMEMLMQRIETLSAEQEKTAESVKKVASVRPSSSNIKDLQIRGRVQGQFGYSWVDNDDGNNDYSTFELRRVRLGMRGTLFDDFRAQVEANMVPSQNNDTFSMRSAFIEWRKHKPAYIKMGYDKPRFGFEENTSSAEILTVERTLINNSLVTGPMTGLSLSGSQGIFSYGTGIYTDRNNSNEDGRDGDRYMLNLSAGIKLDDMMDGAKLRFRGDYLRSDDGLPGAKSTSDNSRVQGFHRDAFAVSGYYALNGFDLRAEYMLGQRDNGRDISGWYIMPSQYLTDNLQAVFRFEMAKMDNSNASTGGDHGLRAPSRYMRRPVNGTADQRGDKYTAGYLGLNYYLAEHRHKFMLGVEMAEMQNTPKGDLTGVTFYTAWRMLF